MLPYYYQIVNAIFFAIHDINNLLLCIRFLLYDVYIYKANKMHAIFSSLLLFIKCNYLLFAEQTEKKIFIPPLCTTF